MVNGAPLLDEDLVLVDSEDLPLRPKVGTASISTTPSINLHTIDAKSGEVLVNITPPRQPQGGLQHTPCDVVLVIDVSASMQTAAEIPNNGGSDIKESSGLSILDLVKHASRTILENLNEHDRLAIVTFSIVAKVIQGLLPMTESEKTETRSRIDALTVYDSTNLWAGLREGLSLFTDTPSIGNAQGMYVLTDGVPNHLNPAQGFCRKLSPMLRDLENEKGQAPIISIFGFGYYLRSSLLRSIAEVGRGSYAFIPDAGMIGTVFVHAVANLFSTYMSDTELILECSDPLATIEARPYYNFNTKVHLNTTTINLGNIQYGQSRDIISKVNNAKPFDTLKASLHYRVPRHSVDTISTTQKLNRLHFLPQAAMDYHVSCHDLCTFLASLYFESNGEHVAIPNSRIAEHHKGLEGLKTKIETRLLHPSAKADKTDLASLLADLKSSDLTETHGYGQISLALQTTIALPNINDNSATSQTAASAKPLPPQYGQSIYGASRQSYYTRWGQHYLPSILHAHAYQLPMSFKDPGLLRYGINSPLFIKCRDDLDNAFDQLPAPTPSLAVQRSPRAHSHSNLNPNGVSSVAGNTGSTQLAGRYPHVQISRFNRVDNACFAGECLVRSADGAGYIRVEEVRPGDLLRTTTGQGRRVREVLVTRATYQRLIGLSIGCHRNHNHNAAPERLWITPWHPISIDGLWRFPQHIEGAQTRTMHNGLVYSFLLEKDTDDMAHTVEVGGVICTTLGHGLIRRDAADSEQTEVDVRYHQFFGDYDAVAEDMKCLDTDEFGRRISGGVGKRRTKDGSVADAYGFVRPDEADNIGHLERKGIRARL